MEDNMKTYTDKATARPWKLPASNREGFERVKLQGIPSLDAMAITNSDNKAICLVFKSKANAELIVRAVNSHDALVNACELALTMIKARFPLGHGMEDVGKAWEACENVLKKVKGE